MSDSYSECEFCDNPAEPNESFCTQHLTPSPFDALAADHARLLEENERLRALLAGVYSGLGKDSRAGDASWRLATLDAIGAALSGREGESR